MTVAASLALTLFLAAGALADVADIDLIDEFFAREDLKAAFRRAKEGAAGYQKPVGPKTLNVGDGQLERAKREDPDPEYREKLKVAAQIEANIEKRLGQELELIPFDLDNENETVTEEVAATTTETPSSLNFTDSGNDVIVLNDFIRFKRDADGEEKGGDREPRGAVREEWVKRPYPVQEDGSVGEGLRAPRVHFVTHRMSTEAAHSPPFYRSFDGDLAGDVARDMDRDFSYRTKYYEYPHNYRYRPEPYYNHYDDSRDRRFYNPRYEHYDRYNGPEQYSFSNRQQRRIIYYATLPEVRNKYAYYDRYDDRYPSPSETYKFRKQPSFSATKSRYEQDMEGTKTPYPLKVSTDVNVREVKKNPERRIYSETERRYAFKAPAFQEEGNNFGGNQ